MPWFTPELDQDIEQALLQRHIIGGRFLDLGTGPGTHAIALAERGFDVTATDVSAHAIDKARRLSPTITFVVDDIIHTRLPPESFDYIFDRGCFHVLPHTERRRYVTTVASLLADGGILFLKTFSTQETGEEGPYRFSPDDIERLFGKLFGIEEIRETVFHGTLQPSPHALFAVLRKK